MIDIVQKDNPILRKRAKNVSLEEIPGIQIQSIISNMKKALNSQDDGVAIAAPQINIPLRIFVVSKRVEIITKKLDSLDKKELAKIQDTVYINPEIIKISRQKKVVDEGCLSVRYLYGKIKRSEKATVTAYDETGKKFTQGGSGLLAQIFQHEIDHLNGILFIDSAKEIAEVLPQTHE